MKGYLRRDGDGHWYLFPIELFEQWEYLTEQIHLSSGYTQTMNYGEESYWDALDNFGRVFEQYRLSGGVESYVWEKVE